ncbi:MULTISPECIES: glutamyl-tRNA reductase [unclassified Chryseobacterium]|jgi:glutamyl-tRNA reductase|uniref:glutamyl-tRNA reductase n=1 Tax=unclassified Chryseobacterium TaxID=2593645 RepID=UPI001C5ABF27|nr:MULTISPECIES: glutamyl-tRNA reductase [unclassified Chryseobacterium]MBW3520621.1 glutamyl-tRNA reductase [Chryseobacterium sp. NKUCC03_KSP]MCD0454254.1 glutamyl-tRNA reductase [Chryseobacterium sp. LC2016-27]
MIQYSNIHQTSNFAVLSISFEKADVETRGKFAFFDDNIKNFVTRIHDENLGDAFVVSTCNRTEIYTTSPNYLLVAEEYCRSIGVNFSDFLRFANIFTKEEALQHLFRVSAGLESQIIGDFEIIGQIKKAYARFKKERQNSNPFLERSINSAIQISKRIKNETGISNGAASVSYAAVHYILNNQKRITEKNILLLGVGEIGQNTVENLVKHVYQPSIKIANRTQEKAAKISEKYNIPNIDYNDLEKELDNTDILIVATGAKTPIINRSHLKNGKEILIIDLSIPHNVDKDVSELDNVTLIDVDELSKQIQETIQQREKEIPKAEVIIKEMTKDFLEWEKKRKLAPNIHHFKAVLKNMERNEMHNFYRKNKYININDMELSEKMIQKITNRFAKYIIDNPLKAEEISKLMHEILVEQPNNEFNEKH